MATRTPESEYADSRDVDGMFRSYGKTLVRWLKKRLRSPEDAEDIAQEAYVRLQRVPEEILVRDPRAYLFQIAHHVMYEHTMKEKRNPVERYDSQTADRVAGSEEHAVPDSAASLEIQQQLEKAFAELPKPYQTVLLLVCRDGMTYPEAAAASGLSVHTVEKYLVKARAQIAARDFQTQGGLS